MFYRLHMLNDKDWPIFRGSLKAEVKKKGLAVHAGYRKTRGHRVWCRCPDGTLPDVYRHNGQAPIEKVRKTNDNEKHSVIRCRFRRTGYEMYFG